jgi:hypothetical protein
MTRHPALDFQERFAMSSRAVRVGLAAVTTITLVGLPASSVIAATAPVAATAPQVASRVAPHAVPAKLPTVLVDVSGLYEFNFGGHTGWVLLKHHLNSNSVFAWIHEDGQTRRLALTARYDYRHKLIRLSRLDSYYRYEYYLWVAQKSPTDRLDFGGYVDKYPLRRPATEPTYLANERAGASLHYVADDAD